MSRFLQDILRQPEELLHAIDYLNGTGRDLLESAARRIRAARRAYITGIGASWHAAMGAATIFFAGGQPVYALDASEMLQFGEIPPGAVIMVLSRSGKSVEIVKLLVKAHAARTTIIGITSTEDSILAHEADIPVIVPVKPDHGISVNTYSALAAVAAAIASAVVGSFDAELESAIRAAIAGIAMNIPGWQRQLSESSWLRPGATYFFLARGSSLASAHEASLLWEEGAKSPAAAMGTGNFRHGPQEVIGEGLRIAMWIDTEQMREQDLAVAHDMRALGASVMLVGWDIPDDAAELVFQLPRFPSHWQFLADIIPPQLAAERLAGLAGVDCDSFRFATYIVEDDRRLLPNGIVLRC